MIKRGNKTFHIREPLLVFLTETLEVVESVQNRLVGGKRHQGHLLSESQVLDEEGSIVLQFVVDLVREALIGLLFNLNFFAVVVCFEFGALPIHIVELQDSQVSERAGFSNRGACIQKLL